MDISLTEAESCFYDKLFNLVDVEKVGKLSKLKSDEFLRSSSEIDDEILMKVSLATMYSIECPNIARQTNLIALLRIFSILI